VNTNDNADTSVLLRFGGFCCLRLRAASKERQAAEQFTAGTLGA